MHFLMTSKVSVIIPFYFNKRWLGEAIESVFNQTYKNLEIIVVNDGSKEDISDLEKSYSDKIRFIKQKNQGAATARNNAIEICRGDYVAFLDSDDLWLPEKLHEQISFMEKNQFQWSHTDYIRFWDKTKKEKNIKCDLKGNIFPKSLIWNPIATPCIIVKRLVLIENTNMRFAKEKKIGEDSYLWQQIGEKFDLGYLPKSLVKVRIHGNNAAFQAHLQLKNRKEAIQSVRKYKNRFTSKFIYYYYLWVLKYCSFIYNILSFAVKILKLNNASSEFIYKIVYLFPYINFRILRLLI